MEDPAHPGHFNTAACGGYRLNPANSLLGAWDSSIPAADESIWSDPAVAKARSSGGALEDSFYIAIGHRLWDASFITAPTLIIAAERDFWSRPEDRQPWPKTSSTLLKCVKLSFPARPTSSTWIFRELGEASGELIRTGTTDQRFRAPNMGATLSSTRSLRSS
jgi:hypothetical protein